MQERPASGGMKVGLHGSIPLLAARLKVWSSKAAACGLTVCKWAQGQPTDGLQLLVVGPTAAAQQLPEALPVVHTSWLETSLAAGCPVPVGRHLVTRQTKACAAGAAGGAAGGSQSAAGAAGLKRPRTPAAALLQPPPHPPSSTSAAQPSTAAAAEQEEGNPDRPPGSKRRAVVSGGVLRQESQEEPTAAVPRWFIPAAALHTTSGGVGAPPQNKQPSGAGGTSSMSTFTYPPAPAPAASAGPPPSAAPAVHPGAVQGEARGVEQQQQASGAGEFVVVSYNVLADKWISSKAFCPRALRAWSHRWPRIVAELQQYDADIICLQEVDEPLWATHYLPWATQHGYNAFHWPRPYTEKGDTREGIALLVRQAVFEVVGTSAVPFKELAPQPPPVGQERFWQRVSGFQEGVLMAALRLRSTGQPLLACCTHLWFDPKHPDIKVAQADALCAAVVDYRDSNPWGGGLQELGGRQAAQQELMGGQAAQQQPHDEDQDQVVARQMDIPVHSTVQQERRRLPEHYQQVDYHHHHHHHQQQQQQQQSHLEQQLQQPVRPTHEGQPQRQPHPDKQQQQQEQEQGQQQQEAQRLNQSPCVPATPVTQVPVIIAGDFNSLWRKYKSDTFDKVPPGRWVTSGVYELMSTGSLSPHHWHHPAARAMFSGWGRRALPVSGRGAGSTAAGGGSAAAGDRGGQPPSSSITGCTSRSASADGGGDAGLQQGHQVGSGVAVAAGCISPGSRTGALQAAAGPPPPTLEHLSQQQPQGAGHIADTTAGGVAAGGAAASHRTAAGTTSSTGSSGSKRMAWVPSQSFSTHGLQLSSAYWLAQGREPPLTNKHTGFAGCLDYIWMTPQQLRVTATLAMPYECMGLREVPQVPEAVPFPPIPNYSWPSDHLAVGARLQLVGM